MWWFGGQSEFGDATGLLSVGPPVPITVTLKVVVVRFPDASVAVAVSTVVPRKPRSGRRTCDDVHAGTVVSCVKLKINNCRTFSSRCVNRNVFGPLQTAEPDCPRRSPESWSTRLGTGLIRGRAIHCRRTNWKRENPTQANRLLSLGAVPPVV